LCDAPQIERRLCCKNSEADLSAIRPGISQRTGLPRFVIRIRAYGRDYHYFRHGDRRVRLPAPTDAKFPGTYASLLVAHGLADLAVLQSRPYRSIKPRVVYFIEDAARALIKIGVTRWPKRRLDSLQIGAGTELKLLATTPGEEDVEREWHRRFAHLRTRGEWFRDTPELRAAIAAL
jgi:hypothetical protein